MITFKELKRNLKKEVPDYPIVRIALVGDTATQFLATAIKGMGIERGYQVDLFEAEYNQVERQFMDPTSESIAYVQWNHSCLWLMNASILLPQWYQILPSHRKRSSIVIILR